MHPVPAEAVCVQLTTDCTQTLARPLSRARSSGWQGHRLLQAVAAATADTVSDQIIEDMPHVGHALLKQLEMQKQLHDQLLAQRRLQSAIEEHGRYLATILARGKDRDDAPPEGNID